MAPLENRIISNSKTPEGRLCDDETMSNSPIPATNRSNRKRARKRKSTEGQIETPVPSKRDKLQNKDSSILVIDLDSDTASNSANDDIEEVTLDNETKEIVLSGSSDNESVNLIESEIEVVDVESNSSDSDNIVINTSQPINFQKTFHETLKASCDLNDNSVINNQFTVFQRTTRKRIHWTEAEGFPKSWTKEMIRFYMEPCERNKNFDYVEILNQKNTKPADWRINRADLYNISRKRRSFNQCRKCDKMGHHESQCPKSFVCYMCGVYGHKFPRCPYSYCYTCGRETKKSTRTCDHCVKVFISSESCKLCGQMYHVEETCPSNWRKYLVPNTIRSLTLNARKFCYNCAAEGHFGFECSVITDTEYPPENPLVTSGVRQFILPSDTNNNVIFLSKDTADFLHTGKGNEFLKNFSANLGTRVELFSGVKDYIKIMGHSNALTHFKECLDTFRNNET